MKTWVEELEEDKRYYQKHVDRLNALAETARLLDSVGIPADGGSFWNKHITIRNADETTVPKLVSIKTAPATKYFNEYSGELGYITAIGDILITVVPDTTKYVCKVTKTERSRTVETVEKDVSYHLDSDCDPLFFEEATEEEVVE